MFIFNNFSTCSNIRLVLLKMGIMMPETCWEIVKNKHLTVASCWFSLSLYYKDIICIIRTLWSSFLIIFLSYVWHFLHQPWTYLSWVPSVLCQRLVSLEHWIPLHISSTCTVCRRICIWWQTLCRFLCNNWNVNVNTVTKCIWLETGCQITKNSSLIGFEDLIN